MTSVASIVLGTFVAIVSTTNVTTGDNVTTVSNPYSSYEECMMEMESEMKSLGRELEDAGFDFKMEGQCRRER